MMKFEEILNTFENKDLVELTLQMIETIPPYFYEVPASSTGKYHPAYSLGNGGLYRHTLAVCKIMNHLFEIMTWYTSRERDLLRIAAIMHDTRKSGTQEDFENNKYTKFEHPLLAAEIVRSFKNDEWNHEEIELIASSIESHMGKWNTSTRSKAVLPLPKNKYQSVLHWCDYLASRKDIIITFNNGLDTNQNHNSNDDSNKSHDNNLKVWYAQCIEKRIMPYGKHKGEKLEEIPISYFEWLATNTNIRSNWLKKEVDLILNK